MRVLLTGSEGFIGRNLSTKLLINKFEVSSMDTKLSPDHDIKRFENFRKFRSDQIDIVIHLAADAGVEKSLINPSSTFNNNVLGTVNCLEFAKQNKVKQFIFASTCAIYSKKLSPYGASKIAGESYCHAYSDSFGLKVDILRIGNVYGPWSENKTSVVASFVKQSLNGSPLKINGTGSQLRHFIYVDDLTEAVIEMIMEDSLLPLTIHNIMNSYLTSIKAIAEEVCDISKATLGHDTGLSHVPMRPESSMSSVVGAKYGKTSIKEGIKQTFKWYLQNYDSNNK